MKKTYTPVSVSRRQVIVNGLCLGGLALTGLTLAERVKAADDVLVITGAVVPQPPPGVKIAAGFMHLENTGTKDIELVGASSDLFKQIEIHRSTVEEGVAKMIKQESVIIPAGGSVVFKHGDFHLMLMGPQTDLTMGLEIPLTLETTAGSIDATFKVQSHHQ